MVERPTTSQDEGGRILALSLSSLRTVPSAAKSPGLMVRSVAIAGAACVNLAAVRRVSNHGAPSQSEAIND